jgi:N-acetylmuramoyl-L-alanine amidase
MAKMVARVSLFRVWATVVAMLAAGLLAASLLASGAEGQETNCTGDVVVDAGHGGSDWGAVNNNYGLKEKEQNLDVAYRLEALLEADGHAVCMTRTGDETLSNNDRYTYANKTGAQLLVSVHMNGSSNPEANYTTTLFGKWRKDKELANTVLDGLYPTLGIPRRDPYSYASGVLLKSEMPATIAETVFITSDYEGLLLSDSTGARQQQIAEALESGVESYLAANPPQPDGDTGGHPKGGPPGKTKS